MEEDFAQGTTPLGALRGILGNYPYSVGLFRELLQNSDDAGAAKQVFVLDRRTHSTTSLYHPKLASTQGPALLAYNDAKFNAYDWHALKFAYESSKADDSSKIGKYGVGFRSVFHITDCPQIVSGNVFAMFDPLQAFTDSAGKRLNLSHVFSQHPDQLTSFEWFLKPQSTQSDFSGTIIRCPLRHTASKISSKVVGPHDIDHLFHEFIYEEIEISLLFLQNIQHIEIHDINERGVSKCMAKLSISRSAPVRCGNNDTTYTATVTIDDVDSLKDQKVWRIVQCPFRQEEAVELLSKRSSGDITRILKEHKLLPNIGIATPLDPTSEELTSGRLFTFLPLPLPTGFPVHLHAYFALTQSRQNLRNSREIGLVPGTDDYILIEWNKLLFDHYIPQAWKLFLEVLADMDGIFDIFKAWPPEQRSPATSGENVYWESLPARMFEFIASASSPIWPVYHGNNSSPPEFRPLDSLIVSEPTIPRSVLHALTAVRLRFTCPPQYVVDLIKNSRFKTFAILTPEEAHNGLLTQLDMLRNASKEDISVILQYLLSTQNVLNLVDLPIITAASGQIIALSPASANTSVTYTLLVRTEFDVFGSCDDNAIPLHLLPLKVADTLRIHGPGSLNVETLAVPRIIDYLTIYPNRLGLDLSLVRNDPLAVKWLSVFWIWFNTYVHKDELYPRIRHLFLLPSSRGLRTAETPLFKSRGEHPVSVQHLSFLGVPFLDADLSEIAQGILALYGLLKSISDIHTLLDLLPSTPTGLQALSKDACVSILKHLSSRASGSCIMHGPFNEEQIRRLRNLPIFPVVHFPFSDRTPSTIATEWTRLPDGLALKSVANPSFLPSIGGVVFVQLSSIAPDILQYLEPSNPVHLSDVQLLSLTVDHFVDQPDHIQAAALRYISQHRLRIPPYILETVRQAEFVAVQDGTRRMPMDVVDPDSPIAPLYQASLAHQVRRETLSDQVIVQALQSLELMQRSLTIQMAQERIDAIASDPHSLNSVELSRLLLSLMGRAHLEYSQLTMSPEQRWLPTTEGLRGPGECRDGTRFSPHLFDRVLAVLEPFNIPYSLRQALGWDRPLSTEVLIQQLDRVLQSSEDVFSVVLDIMKELGSRSCGDVELSSLRSVTHDRKWVPTTDRQLSHSMNAIFSQPMTESGFYQIYPIDQRTQDFLRRMGCTDRPTTDAILFKLQAAREQPPSLNIVNVSLSLLRSLPSDLNDEERSQLLVPDVTNTLRPFSETFFNDIGDQARLIPSENNFISHHLLDESLARKLNLGRLGLKYVGLSIPGVDMGEKPVITVRKNLGQYTEKQFVTEFLANASDANATEFSLLVNDFHPNPSEDIQALSPVMAKFCVSPSLVVHNNAMFADEDFEGICRTSIGGKGGKRDKIGQFGLGALTMFHFTELAMVVSNTNVLFLNPSKEHLPIPDLAALMVPLNHVRMFYRSHLASIDGLFGFSLSNTDPYNGTIFLLPLRQDAHCEGPIDPILRITWTPAEVERSIVEYFRKSASNCLLFTRMEKISGIIRDSGGHQRESWSFRADRVDSHTESHTGFSVIDTVVSDSVGSTSTWKVAKAVVSEAQIPQDFQSLAVERRLRLPPVAGLAIFIDESPRPSFKFFSTLPLAIPTSLPLHIMASFVLSSDRRQIRLDEYGGPETQYNKWLLSDIIPPLYLFLLEHLLQLGDERDNRHWWPQHRSDDDSYSRIVVEAFYSHHLGSCTRKLFHSFNFPAMSLLPEEAVLSGDEPTSVDNALSALQAYRTVKLPKGVHRLATERAGIAKVNAAFLKAEIMQDSSAVTELSFKIVEDVISYLSDTPPGGPSHLLGLGILPLEDGTFGTFLDQSDPTHYFVWMPQDQSRYHNFPLHYFVHHKLKVRSLLKMGLNIVPLDSAAIRQFVDKRLPTVSPFDSVPPEVSNWIFDFWETWNEYTYLKLHHTDISEFPLVPTINPNTFVSLAQCKDASVMLVGGSTEEDELLRTCLDQLDLNVVRLDEEPTPIALCLILQRDGYPSLTFENVLRALASQQDSVADKFRDLDSELQTTFASWAWRNIGEMPQDLLAIAQTLPLWPSARNGSAEELRSASDIYMLPEGLSFRVAARFMNVFVADYGMLKSLNGPSLTFEQLGDKVELPSILGTADLMPYKNFLERWIPRLPPSYTRPILVPNANRVITLSNELYAREPLFQAAFGDDSNRFIPEEFVELEQALYKHGLRSETQLNIPMFRLFAQALNDRQQEDRAIRAALLFEAYCVSLPMRVGANEQASWHELDELSFIPRDMNLTRRLEDQGDSDAGLDIPTTISNMPDVVPPLNLVRKEFEAVAWTQRALFAVQPHQRVLLAYPPLGRPHMSEVIQHLRALSSFANLSRQQRGIVLHDLIATYDYLNNNISAANSDDIAQLSVGNLFLNIDDPDVEAWRWDNSDQLVFETQDTEGSMRYVRSLLLPFERLLRAAGVLQVYHPQYSSSHSTDSETSKLEAMRKGFDNLRKEKALTDVVFIAHEATDDDLHPEDSQPLVAHRAFLAALSEYFSDSFCGGFAESRVASPEDPVQLNVSDHSRQCVQLVLDYIYTGIRSTDSASLDLLLETMQLSGYWRINDLFEDMQKEIVTRRLITPLTLDAIRDAAEVSHAENLVHTCTEYEERNSAFIQKVRQSTMVDPGNL